MSKCQPHGVNFAKELLRVLLQQGGLRWTCHGLGFAKAYLSPDLRLHVWDQRFRHPDKDRWDESIHCHRWGLTSVILHGSIRQEEYVPIPAEEGSHVEWEVSNSTSANPLGITNLGVRVNLWTESVLLTAGQSYTMRAGSPHFHRSDAEDGTVTLLHRDISDQSALSSCLIPYGTTPVHGHSWNGEVDVEGVVNNHLQKVGLL